MINFYSIDTKLAIIAIKYSTKFSKTKDLTIKYHHEKDNLINKFVTEWFNSALNLFRIKANPKEEKYGYYFSYYYQSYLTTLKTSNAHVILDNFHFNSYSSFYDAIKCFPQANSIEFYNCNYVEPVQDQEIKIGENHVQIISFTLWCFKSIEIIKRVIIDSGLLSTLDKLSFSELRGDNKDEIKQLLEECQRSTGFKNFIIPDK